MLIDPQKDRTLHRSIQGVQMQTIDEAGISRLEDGRIRVRATAKCPIKKKTVYRNKTMDPGATVAEAVALRDSLKHQIKNPAPISDGPEVITVADYAMLWLKRKNRRLADATIHKYVTVLEARILPRLGHIYLAGLTRLHIRQWLDWCETTTKNNGDLYATATVQSWWRTLVSMLRDAYADGYIEKEVTNRQEAPVTGVYNRQEKATLTSAQVGQLVTACQTLQPQRYAEVTTLCYTGVRISELYGLHWKDVDFKEGTIAIRRKVWKGKVGRTKTGITKTVPCPAVVFEALQEHRQDQMRRQAPGLEKGIVFPSIHGEYRHGTSLRKPLNMLADHLGFSISLSPQVIRRTYNTLLVAAQVDRIVLRSLTGHKTEQMTEHYAGVGMDMKRAAIARVFSPDLGPDLVPTENDLGLTGGDD